MAVSIGVMTRLACLGVETNDLRILLHRSGEMAFIINPDGTIFAFKSIRRGINPIGMQMQVPFQYGRRMRMRVLSIGWEKMILKLVAAINCEALKKLIVSQNLWTKHFV